MPIEILNKNGKLTADEMGIVKQHPLTGAEMTLRFPRGATTEKLISIAMKYADITMKDMMALVTRMD